MVARPADALVASSPGAGQAVLDARSRIGRASVRVKAGAWPRDVTLPFPAFRQLERMQARSGGRRSSAFWRDSRMLEPSTAAAARISTARRGSSRATAGSNSSCRPVSSRKSVEQAQPLCVAPDDPARRRDREREPRTRAYAPAPHSRSAIVALLRGIVRLAKRARPRGTPRPSPGRANGTRVLTWHPRNRNC